MKLRIVTYSNIVSKSLFLVNNQKFKNLMKKRLLTLSIISIISIKCIYSQCPPGDVTFNNQWEIDNFASSYPNCTEINGDLDIGTTYINAINSLLPLSNLNIIQGQLKINNNWSLTSLSGLENISTVGSLWIGYHFSDQLTSLTGLDGLTTVNGDVTIGNNDGLTSLSGLDNLETVDGFIWITQLPAITSISSLNNLSSINDSLYLQFMNSMTSINGFQNLTTINGDFQIAITGLSEIDGFNNLETVNGKLYIQQNNFISDIYALQNIDPASLDEIIITDNPLLSICALSNICTYLDYDSTTHPRTISNNTGDCIDESAVINACNNLDVDTYEFNSGFNVFKIEGSLHITSESLEIERIEIYDISGRLIDSKSVVDNSIVFSNMQKNQLLILRVYSDSGKVSIKKVAI